MHFPIRQKIIFNSENKCSSFFDNNQEQTGKYFCTLDILVQLSNQTNSDQRFYDISYKWNYNPWTNPDLENPGFKYHPFYDNSDFMENHASGEIIRQNELSDMLIKYLLMSLNDMESLTGNTRPIDYKKSIMESISLFWD